MIVHSNAPRPAKPYEEKKVVIKETKKETKPVEKPKKAPLTEDELIEKIIKGEG